MDDRSYGKHRKCYEIDCDCKTNKYVNIRDAIEHAKQCEKAKTISYKAMNGKTTLLWTREKGFT